MTELERCKPWIEAALAYSGDTHTLDDIVNAIIEGKMQLWPTPDACAVSEIIRYPRKKVCHVFLAAGNLGTILDAQPSFEAWAIDQGCEQITLTGRLGWLKTLKRDGWDSHVVMRKELDRSSGHVDGRQNNFND